MDKKNLENLTCNGTVTVLVYNVYYMAQTYCYSLKESILCNVCLLDGLLSWDVRHWQELHNISMVYL